MMIRRLLFLAVVAWASAEKSCYWNALCPYPMYSSKTPYDTVRGDIRDYRNPEGCQAISVWSLHRHGNRKPSSRVTTDIKAVAGLKDEIIQSFESGRSQMCSQDIEEFKKWKWNETLEENQSSLTGIGYEELYDIAKRLREKYPHLLRGSHDKYYFRSTKEQRTLVSGLAFVHGLAEGTDLNLTVDGPWDIDDVIHPYENCKKYQVEVIGGQKVVDELDAYFRTDEFQMVKNNIQERLGIDTQLSPEEVYSLYEICRFYRSWTPTKQSSWCSVFSDQDLVVLEYRDDVRHYYSNGYGSWVNVNLGSPVLKDLYENFEAAVNGSGRNVVSYFTHDTMMEMAFCALGLFKDDAPIRATERNSNRLWKTSFIASFSANLIAVLNSCQESGSQTYRVQLFINERETELCPITGCTWKQFQDNFHKFKTTNLDFCSMNNTAAFEPEINSATRAKLVTIGLIALETFIYLLN